MPTTSSYLNRKLSRRRLLATTGAAGAGGVILAACGGGSGGTSVDGSSAGAELVGTPTAGGTLNLAVSADVANYDYQVSFSVLQTLYTNRLFRYKTGAGVRPNQYEIINDLVTRFEQPSPEQLILHLNPAAKFHNKAPVNGRKLDSEDVRATLELVRTNKPNYVYRYLSDFLTSIEAPDPSTVVLKGAYPTPLIFNSNAYYNSAIAPKEIITRDGNLQKLDIGTGPFTLESNQQNVGLKFEKNPEYFQSGQPYLDAVNLTIIPDANARLNAIKTGQVEALDVDVSLIDAAKQTLDKSFTFQSEPGVGWNAFWFNVTKPPFNDKRLRQAVSAAIDRNAFKAIASQGKAAVRVGPVARGWDWSRPEAEVQADAKRDLTKAKQLLSAAGFPNGLDVDWLASESGVRVKHGEVAQQLLKEAGINMKFNLIDNTALNTNLQNGDFTFSIWNIRAYPDPDDYLYPFFYTDAAKNFGRVNDTALNDLILRERKETDAAKRKAILQEIDRRWINDFAYAVWTIEDPFTHVFSSKLANYSGRNPLDYAGLAAASLKAG